MVQPILGADLRTIKGAMLAFILDLAPSCIASQLDLQAPTQTAQHKVEVFRSTRARSA